MKKYIHPLWTHIAAAGAFITLVAYLVAAGPLPASAPVHFGFGGQPDSYGSPWMTFGLTIGLSLFFILLSAFLDELWARQEKKKAFNWLSLFDDIVVGFMSGVSLGYLEFLKSGSATFVFPWAWAGLLGGGAAVLAIVLELVRPYRPYSAQLVSENTDGLEKEIAERLKTGTSFVYWDCQNPFYVALLTTLLPLVMLVSAVLSWFSEPWVSVLLLVVGVLLVLPHGGQRVLVNRQEVVVRFGLAGFRVLRLRTSEITGAELHEFSPLRDFGGYGIRVNREMKAYFMRGTRGVLLETTAGKKYLLGSDTPERLMTVIRTVTAG